MTLGPEIRWGILGTGTVATAFAAGLQQTPGAVIQAVASRTEQTSQQFAQRWGARQAHGSYAALCRDATIDIVYVATPNALHVEHAMLALESGKPVLCEKPFALDATSGRTVVATASARGLFLMEAMWMRCSPTVDQALQAIRAGAVGTPMLLSGQMGSANAPTVTSRLFASPGGGALYDLGVYPLALAQTLFGRPSKVLAHAAVGVTGVDELASVILGYPDGEEAVFTVSIRSPLSNSATISGTGGSVTLAPLYFPTTMRTRTEPAGTQRLAERAGFRRIVSEPRLRHVVALARMFRDARRAGGPRSRSAPSGYAVEALEVMRCLRAGLTESPAVPLADTSRRAGHHGCHTQCFRRMRAMRFAVVGCGFVADAYLATLKNYPDLELLGVYDRDAARCRQFAAYHNLHRYESYDLLLADDRVELVANLTNPDSHYEVSRRALHAGRHVYSEKPLATSLSGAEELVAIAEANQRLLACAPCSLLGETAQTLWRALREGRIGIPRLRVRRARHREPSCAADGPLVQRVRGAVADQR